jgi:hypothetical protein
VEEMTANVARLTNDEDLSKNEGHQLSPENRRPPLRAETVRGPNLWLFVKACQAVLPIGFDAFYELRTGCI